MSGGAPVGAALANAIDDASARYGTGTVTTRRGTWVAPPAGLGPGSTIALIDTANAPVSRARSDPLRSVYSIQTLSRLRTAASRSVSDTDAARPREGVDDSSLTPVSCTSRVRAQTVGGSATVARQPPAHADADAAIAQNVEASLEARGTGAGHHTSGDPGKTKGPLVLDQRAFQGKIPAATYSPTQLPMQYHRR